MRIFGLLLVKDEADILRYTLDAALEWCDRILVFDNGSTDGTDRIVAAWAQTYDRISFYTSRACRYSPGLRAELFHHFRDDAADGDWWCRLDADELYIDDPRIFLAKVPQRYAGVWNASFQYQFTDLDLRRYEQDPNLYTADRHPLDRLRYYRNDWSELRFIRHRDDLVWPSDKEWPVRLGAYYPVRIWLRHFKYRGPEQMQRRALSRRAIAQYTGNRNFAHETRRQVDPCKRGKQDELWKRYVVPHADLDHDHLDGRLNVREDLMPPIGGTFAPLRAAGRRLGLTRDLRAMRMAGTSAIHRTV